MPQIAKLIIKITLLLAIVLGANCPGFAGGGPESVLIVVNANSDSSKLIANTYISLRGIPDRNIVYLDDIPFKEAIEFDEFETKILRPVLATIEDRKLSGSIDYIVYSSDFPTNIRMPAQRKKMLELAEKEPGVKVDELFRALRRGEASLTGLTYMAGRTLHVPESILFDLASNRYFRWSRNHMLKRPFVGPLQKEFERSISAFENPKTDPLFESAITSLEQMAKKNPGQTALLYWLARFNAKRGDVNAATRWMTRAIAMGWSDRSGTLADPAFSDAKDDPVFNGLVKRMSNDGSRDIASRGFRQLYQWGPNGMINRTAGQGERYFLSAMLAVTRNDGNTEAEAVRQLTRAVAADFTKPRGTFCFMKTANPKAPRVVNRVPRFGAAVIALQEMGYQAEILNTDLPKDRDDILGLTSGLATFNFERTGSSIVPGAICENLTSFGGRMGQIGGQTKLTEFLRHGAAGSSGTVVEPMNHPFKFPDPMIHVHYARGCTLAEAFYQSIRGPFHMLIVGDALCQPFATPPKIVVAGVEPMSTISGTTELRFDRSQTPVRISGMELYLDGVMSRRDRKFEPISIDSNLMSDGYHEIRVVAFAANQIETRGSVVIPIVVENKGHSCKLEVEKSFCGFDDTLSFSFSAIGADKVRLVQHQRVLYEAEAAAGTTFVEAKILGRGKTTVRAIATIDGKEVSSFPLQIQINGPLSETRVRTAKPKKPKAKPAPAKAKSA